MSTSVCSICMRTKLYKSCWVHYAVDLWYCTHTPSEHSMSFNTLFGICVCRYYTRHLSALLSALLIPDFSCLWFQKQRTSGLGMILHLLLFWFFSSCLQHQLTVQRMCMIFYNTSYLCDFCKYILAQVSIFYFPFPIKLSSFCNGNIIFFCSAGMERVPHMLL